MMMKTNPAGWLGILAICCALPALSGCPSSNCEPRAERACVDDTVYWVSSCGDIEELIERCDCGCTADHTACASCCTPECTGKECGPDGCGDTCAPGCGAGETCNAAGICEACVPDCAGRECGPDGCGSTCGPGCLPSETCNAAGICEACVPDCAGKECGPDGCSGTCGPGCPAGETCNDSGTCEACAPDCAGRSCGPDSCGGNCPPGCGEGEACTPGGACVETQCGATPATTAGSFRNDVADVTFTGATASLQHKRDIDEYEDGCITRIDLVFSHSDGCRLQAVAAELLTEAGGLTIQSIEFSADSFCPSFPDATEGRYLDSGGLVLSQIRPGVLRVPGRNVAESCVDTTLTLELEGVLNRVGDGRALVVPRTTITVTGEFGSLGDTQVSCPCQMSCAGNECGDDGCGGSCGTCTGNYEWCVAGSCECRYETCGSTCCSPSRVCHQGSCCLPDCTGRECGGDGCGGSCGSCEGAHEVCSSDGACVCGNGSIPCGGECILCDDPHGAGSCADGQCVIECHAGFHLCAGVCESDHSTDHCGTSCSPCPDDDPHGSATCDGETCGTQCDTGFLLCEGACAACPTPGSGEEVGCVGDQCVITRCAAGHYPCGNSCCPWSVTVVDSGGDVGEYSSLALDHLERPHISYWDDTNDTMKYARFSGVTWDVQTPDPGIHTAWDDISIAVDSDGHAHIAYVDSGLRLAEWTGTAWDFGLVDNSGFVGFTNDIALDGDDYPRIAYMDNSNYVLKYASWTGASWSVQSVSGTYSPGGVRNIHMELDAYGDPHVSYHHGNDENLMYAQRNSGIWSVLTVDDTANVGYHNAIALDSQDRPHISYVDSDADDLKYARWTGSEFAIEVVDADGYVGFHNAIWVDSDDHAHITYAGEDEVRYAHWTGTDWIIEVVAAVPIYGFTYTDLVLDSNDDPHIIYFDNRDDDLVYATH